MKRSNRLLILLGFLIAIAGALAAVGYVSSGGSSSGAGAAATPTATPEPTVQVVVATKAISAGTTIDATMVATKSVTISERDALGATFDSTDSVIGKIAGADIADKQVLVASTNLLGPGSVIDGKSIKMAQ